MYSLKSASLDAKYEPLTRVAYEDLQAAIKRHLTGTHITRTFSDGSSGRIEVIWDPRALQFTDPGNNIWMRYKKTDPESLDEGGHWEISVRTHSVLGRDPVAEAMVQQANEHGKKGRVNQVWRMYWMLILHDNSNYYVVDADTEFDIHIGSFDEAFWLACKYVRSA